MTWTVDGRKKYFTKLMLNNVVWLNTVELDSDTVPLFYNIMLL